MDTPQPQAKIATLRGKWNAHAAIANAMQQIPVDGKVVVLWFDKDDYAHFNSSNVSLRDLLWLAEFLRRQAVE